MQPLEKAVHDLCDLILGFSIALRWCFSVESEILSYLKCSMKIFWNKCIKKYMGDVDDWLGI